MLMIPLTYVFAALSLGGAILVARSETPRWGWAAACLILFAFQEFLVGTRFGYGKDMLREVQPFTAALLPPLGYLAFRRPAFNWPVCVHLLPFVAVCFSIPLWIEGMDLSLGFANPIYVGLLVRLALRGSDGLAWVNLNNARVAVSLMWIVAAVLFVSGITDVVIGYDFLVNSGANTGRIAGIASTGSLAVLVLMWVLYSRSKPKQDRSDAEQALMFPKVDDVVRGERLFADPDINLSRMARRLHMPARDVSKAINQATELNVSQYVNGLRIEEACRVMQTTEISITEVVFQCGFNTKSNFNREFLRVKGVAPSVWRKEAA
jgi:AraC-like DNA-binding protein